jgi:hypothetical protein
MDIITDMRHQRAVYWAPGIEDDSGQKTFGEPEEILVRWEEAGEVYRDRAGNEMVSRAVVYVPQLEDESEVEEQGVLWLSSKTDEDSDGSALDELASTVDPFANDGAYEIQKFEKVPTLDADDFVRNAYL